MKRKVAKMWDWIFLVVAFSGMAVSAWLYLRDEGNRKDYEEHKQPSGNDVDNQWFK